MFSYVNISKGKTKFLQFYFKLQTGFDFFLGSCNINVGLDKPNGVPKVEIVPPGATENGSRLAETDVDSVPVASTDSKKGGDDEEDETSSSEGGDGGGVNQDKSVLQTKLTKLTILIGKLGKIRVTDSFHDSHAQLASVQIKLVTKP